MQYFTKKKTYLLSVTSCQNFSSSQLLASLTSLPRFSKTSTTSFPSSSVLQQLTFSLFLHRTEVPYPHLPGSASSALASHSFSLHHLPDDRLYFTEILFPYRRKKPSQHQSLVGFCSFFFFFFLDSSLWWKCDGFLSREEIPYGFPPSEAPGSHTSGTTSPVVASPIRAGPKSFLDDSMPHSGNLKFSAEQGESVSSASTRKQWK